MSTIPAKCLLCGLPTDRGPGARVMPPHETPDGTLCPSTVSVIDIESPAVAGAAPPIVADTSRLTPVWRTYHWANAVILPIIVALLATTDQTAVALLVGWVTVSSLFDRRVRGWVVRAWTAVIGGAVAGGIALGIIATLTAFLLILVIVFIVAIALTLAIFALAIYLWINSIVCLVRDYRQAQPA
ncbi:MAG: hypothetical protein AB7R89_34230 [Dehalococcoidia bacterium]